MIGETVGNYRIESKLAEGGMGAVYRAVHPLLGKPAAVKVLLPELSGNREIVNRFFNEARAATSVRHPGIVEIFDFGYMPSGIAYIVMEMLQGETLSRRLARGVLDETLALLFVRGIASALAAAHAQDIVHRDLKPDNVFVVPDPDMPSGVRIKLLDFGIAKVAEAMRSNEATKTRTGSVMGTPTYMSPEQCRGSGTVDHRADLYSLGCILYEMVVGRPPFAAEGVGEIIGAHLYMPPTPPSQLVPSLSANLESLVMNLLAKDPNDRLQSAAEVVRLLGPGTLPIVGAAVPVAAPSVPAYRTPPPPGSAAFTMPGTHPGVAAGVAKGATSPGAPTVVAGGTVPPVSTPTTLGGATVVIASPADGSGAAPRRRKGLVAALGLAVAGGAAAAVLAVGGGGSSATPPATTPASGAATPPLADDAAAKAQADAAADAAAAKAQADAAAAKAQADAAAAKALADADADAPTDVAAAAAAATTDAAPADDDTAAASADKPAGGRPDKGSRRPRPSKDRHDDKRKAGTPGTHGSATSTTVDRGD